MKTLAPIAALLAATAVTPAIAHDRPADEVSAERLRADVERLVAFGTRHTLSSQEDPERGIGAAIDWGAETFRGISADCGGCLTIELPETMIEGDRIPGSVRLRNVVAIQPGTQRPNEVVIVQGHIDSRASDVMDGTVEAPGANDDGSGTALVIEAARVLAGKSYPTTIVYALLSGEEQGLYGGRLLVDWVESKGYTVKAVLNNDVVGNSCGSDGYCDAAHVRVFSEGPRADLTDRYRAAQRREGGENDSPSRNLSRWLDGLADDDATGLDVRQIWRTDRMGRGGDQIPFLETGYPAVRFSVAVEDYEHQHQDLRTEDGVVYGDTVDEMDFDYLAKVTQLNVRALERLAAAPMPPAPRARAAVRTFTELTWPLVDGASEYHIWQRRTDDTHWQAEPIAVLPQNNSKALAEQPDFVFELVGVRGDDWFFGVSACSESGACSPVASAVPGGAFAPIGPRGDND